MNGMEPKERISGIRIPFWGDRLGSMVEGVLVCFGVDSVEPSACLKEFERLLELSCSRPNCKFISPRWSHEL